MRGVKKSMLSPKLAHHKLKSYLHLVKLGELTFKRQELYKFPIPKRGMEAMRLILLICDDSKAIDILHFHILHSQSLADFSRQLYYRAESSQMSLPLIEVAKN